MLGALEGFPQGCHCRIAPKAEWAWTASQHQEKSSQHLAMNYNEIYKYLIGLAINSALFKGKEKKKKRKYRKPSPNHLVTRQLPPQAIFECAHPKTNPWTQISVISIFPSPSLMRVFFSRLLMVKELPRLHWRLWVWKKACTEAFCWHNAPKEGKASLDS